MTELEQRKEEGKKTLSAPFVSATKSTVEMMCGLTVTVGDMYEKSPHEQGGAVSGVIGFAGSTLSGSLVVSFDSASIIAIVNSMLQESFTELTAEVVDAVGELTNIILGGAKRELAEMGHSFDMAQPIVITGPNVELHQLSKFPVSVIPFSVENGKFFIEISFNPVR